MAGRGNRYLSRVVINKIRSWRISYNGQHLKAFDRRSERVANFQRGLLFLSKRRHNVKDVLNYQLFIYYLTGGASNRHVVSDHVNNFL